MAEEIAAWLRAVDGHLAAWSGALLWPLAIYILLSGIDDLAADLLRFLRHPGPAPPEPEHPPRIAILVPLWQEAAVAAPMLRHNLSAISYPSYRFFVGVYRNDPETRRAVEECARDNDRIQLCRVPHDGPTSKADCLNWIWAGIAAAERAQGIRYDLFVLHDAEDLIDPLSLSRLSRWSSVAGMVQMPVLPLATPLTDWTHGVYCDDFAESQAFDLESRVRAGAFLPGCGVGTAFRRDAMEKLMEGRKVPFDETLLTEDYDTGLRLALSGVRQVFVPLDFQEGRPVATREYFPRTAASAIRQRGRWVAGNALQSWSRHGWTAPPDADLTKRLVNWWFLWRDRKGLWGNALSLTANAVLLYGAVAWALGGVTGQPWGMGAGLEDSVWLSRLLALNLGLLLIRLHSRMEASRRVYGLRFALGVLPRMFWGNYLNTRATLRALRLWAAHVWAGRALPWGKTAHHYPLPGELTAFARPLEEVLVSLGFAGGAELAFAEERRQPGESVADCLLRLRMVTPEQLCEATAVQTGVPLARLPHDFVPGRVVRTIPEALQQRWHVLPYGLEPGALYVAVSHPPGEELHRALQRWTGLEIRFRLLAPAQFRRIREQLSRSSYNPGNEALPGTVVPDRRDAAAGAE